MLEHHTINLITNIVDLSNESKTEVNKFKYWFEYVDRFILVPAYFRRLNMWTILFYHNNIHGVSNHNNKQPKSGSMLGLITTTFIISVSKSVWNHNIYYPFLHPTEYTEDVSISLLHIKGIYLKINDTPGVSLTIVSILSLSFVSWMTFLPLWSSQFNVSACKGCWEVLLCTPLGVHNW